MTIEKYINNHSDPEDEILIELTRETNLKVPGSRMLSGYMQGKVIEHISKMIKPEKILEIGTYTGYSAICWAKGLKENGIIHTIEINDERKSIINKYFKKANVKSKIKLHIGDALKIIPTLDDNFDIVFIDADKPSYLKYYKLVINKVKKGAYIIADNVLWGGKVIEDKEITDESTKGIIEFNKYVKQDTNVENIILPIRDGIMLIRKK
ncbi:MAG: O-methyltransferase [Bacteroidales bacterium]|nr:O-methyltransferase [Bacteroidales bacterium]